MENPTAHPLFAEKIDYSENAALFSFIEAYYNGMTTQCECAEHVAPLILALQNRVSALRTLATELENEAKGVSSTVAVAFAKLQQAMKKNGVSSIRGDFAEIFPNGVISDVEPAPADDASIDEIGKAIVIRQGQIERMKSEIERLRAQINDFENANGNDRQHLLDDLTLSGVKKKSGKVFVARISKTKAVNVTDEEAVPCDYFKTSQKVNISAVKEALLAGKRVKGCELEEHLHVTITK